jgi:TonB-linked SusC/RagA family outer membrane protein
MKKLSLLLFMFIFTVSAAIAQRTVTGTIVDDTGLALIGANVLIENSTLGTITDIDGNFSLEVPNDATALVVSYTGYSTQTVNIDGLNNVNLTLSQGELLDEIVFTGFTQQKRKDLTGAVSSVKLTDYADVRLPTAAAALQGSSSGVNVTKSSGTPGGGIDVRVRGTTSINASSQPLYVVDGIPIIDDNTDFTQEGVGNAQLSVLSDLNPNEIESMEVIKDAASSAIYGSRAANGVVLITTKKGAKGDTKINFNASRGGASTIKRIDVVDGPTYIEYITEVFGANIVGTEANTNWQDEIFRTGTVQEYSIDLSGGSEKTKYFASLGYNDEEGIIVGSRFQRYSARLNIDQNANDWLDFGMKMGYSNSSTDQVQNDNNIFGALSTAILLPPVVPIFNEDGSFGSAFGLENPVAATTAYSNNVNRNRLQGNVFGRVKILPSLNFTSRVGVDILNSREEVIEPRVLQSSATGRAFLGNVLNQRVVWDNFATYIYENNLNTFNVTAGVSFQQDEQNFSLGETVDFPTDGFTGLSSGAQPLTTNGFFGGDELQSFFGNVNYNYDEKYFIAASVRRDGSSRFVNNRFGTFPGISAAWRISKEDFLGSDGALSDLKLRLGWGQTGNNNVGNFAARQLFGGGENFLDSPGTAPSQIGNPDLRWETTTAIDAGLDFGFNNNRLAGSINLYQKNTTDLLLNRPIPTTSGFNSVLQNIGEVQNRGLELELNYGIVETNAVTWDISFIAAYNQNEVLTLVDGIPIDQGFGSRIAEGQPLGSFYGRVTDGLFQNEAEIENHATQPNAAPGDFRFVDISGGAGDDGILNTADDLAPDGVINDNDRDFLGKAIPDWTGGIRNSINFAGFDLNVFFQFATGFQIYNNNLAFAEGLNSVFAPTVNAWENRWQQEGDITNVPRLVNGDPNGNRGDSDRFVEDGDYLRLKTISLGYTIPRSALSNIGIERARIYVSGYNLLTFTGYSWFDPEVSTFDISNGAAGTDFLTFPQPKQVNVGINVGF